MANTPYGEAMQDVVRQQGDAYSRAGTDLRTAFHSARNAFRDPGYGGAVQYDLPKVMPTGAAMPMGMMSQYPVESRVPQPQNTIVPHGEFPVGASPAAMREAMQPRLNPAAEMVRRPESRVKSVDYGADPLATKVFKHRYAGTPAAAEASEDPVKRRFDRIGEAMRARSSNYGIPRTGLRQTSTPLY
jgi:hypothetical protein